MSTSILQLSVITGLIALLFLAAWSMTHLGPLFLLSFGMASSSVTLFLLVGPIQRAGG